MTNIVHMVEAGVKGLMGIAEGYMSQDDDSDRLSTSSIPSSISSLPASDNLVQTTDVASGWIHIPAAYLDDKGGQRSVKSFGLKNLVGKDVQVEISSDLRDQVVFWTGEDELPADSAISSTSSSSSNPTDALQTILPRNSTITVWLAFLAVEPAVTSPSHVSSNPIDATPRVTAAETRPQPAESLLAPPHSFSISDRSSTTSDTSSQSLAGSLKSASSGGRKQDPVHRAFSIHGLISIRASTLLEVNSDTDQPTAVLSRQTINLPLFATVCRSFFSAALIDPATGLCSGPQISSGRLELDFGPDSVVGGEYHRDILLVNRSEVELVWTTNVVNSRNKDAVWFSLRDLDSENVFGVDTSSQPVPIPPLSSRHLRLELRVRIPIAEFDFDFLVSNVNQPGNVVTCHVMGSGVAESCENPVKILSESNIDFGHVCDGVWAKKIITCKNTGDKPLDVKFSAMPGYDVAFRLAGVAGDDMDEDMPYTSTRPIRKASGSDKKALDRGRDISATRRSPHGGSRSSSIGHDSASYTSSPSIAADFHHDLSRQLSHLDGMGRSAVSAPSERLSAGRDSSQPPSRGLSRVTSRTSSYLNAGGESDDEDDEPSLMLESLSTSPHFSEASATMSEANVEKTMPNQIEELTMRPGTEYRVCLLYRPARDVMSAPEVAGALRESTFRVFLDSTSNSRSNPLRRTIKCTSMSCTSLIGIASGNRIDFGEVTVGASKTATISISNLSALSARVEIAAISKVLNSNRNVIVIPPFEAVEEKIEFFPRRINDRYEKQMFVRNLLNRANDQLIEIRSRNVDVYNLTIHSHLYRILTPSGLNFLDFGSVVINAPTVRTVHFENLTMAPLLLDLMASQPEDVELFVKAEDEPAKALPGAAKYQSDAPTLERVTSPPTGELKERFMETMRELSVKADAKPVAKSKGKAKEKSENKGNEGEAKVSVGAAVAAALKKGGRGRPVQLYGNAVVFKDRSLLEDHEYLDLASGPPVASHRTSPRSKRTQLLDTIELEDRSKLSGQHPKVPKLDFAANAKATGLLKKDKPKKKATAQATPKGPIVTPATPSTPPLSITSVVHAITRLASSDKSAKSPALTAKRAEPKIESSVSDISKMTVDDLLVAIEQQDHQKGSMTHCPLDDAEQHVRRHMTLRKELSNLINSGKIVPLRTLSVQPKSLRKLIVVMTPNGSTRPHISTKAKRADSRIYIKLADFDRSLLSNGSSTDLGDLPVRDLVIRSSCTRSVLEVQQTSINFGGCEKGEAKSKTIVIQNKSDCIGMFRLRTSGSIASGDLKLGSGRLGVIAAFGRKEVEQFSFTPSLVGNYQETLTVENVLDTLNDQKVAVKAVVRKQPAMQVEPASLDFGSIDTSSAKSPELGLVLTNVSKHEKTFVVEVKTADESFASVTLIRDEKGAGTALSKGEEEEVETMLQKLKIARRKGKEDKIKKYESRLAELGVNQPGDQPDEGGQDDTSALATPITEVPPSIITPSLSITLAPSQRSRVLVRLVMQPTLSAPLLAATINIFDRKNTDEVTSIAVSGSIGGDVETTSQTSQSSSQEPLHLAIMRHCLQLTLQCPVSQTAFCVGSTIFLPDTSPSFPTLRPFFPSFPLDDPDPAGLIMGDGYSRQIPGNTHAEANALVNFRSKYAELVKTKGDFPPIEDVLRDTECYATMEPCSYRTSGGPSCALDLVRAKVRTVYLGVEEPPDFVNCEGVRILEDGGVGVQRIVGLEEQCLKAARRGRNFEPRPV